ncbi:ATP-dependent DNA ligase [Olivibacter sp. SDN3]|uniref:ATP-dependent DNA ligase n=1 Tax=Olivibacter sp. SDN3 TaxID=2764720 RepID=UPI001651B14B|nr:ATP-dependent DNA ligase [Olivibacter sp. SDN3]QNL50845.1 ATP-dependent DNA ligase [Olivibacter sp. SDN3]
MIHFNELFQNIDKTTSTNKKVEALVNYFRSAPIDDVLWSIYLLIGKSSGRVIKTAIMRQAAIHLSRIPAWLFEESYHIVGDLAETIALSLPPPIIEKAYTLSETMRFLSNMPTLPDEEKEKAISERWMETAPEERFIFNKLITGNFRVGVSKQLVIKALAITYSKPTNELTHRLMGNWHPNSVTLAHLLLNERAEERSYEPYPFFLAYPLDQEPAKLGDVQDWFIERKYDGIRGQIIVRNQEIYIWSRGEDLLTDKFPEFHPLKRWLPNGTVIDGEILPSKNQQILPFSLLQTRIGRKKLSKKILDDAPLIMICYDLLEHDGQDTRRLPMLKRRTMLQRLLKNMPTPSPLQLSPIVHCQSWEEVKKERLQSRAYFCEGLMLKRKDSIYETGRRRGSWWKWKIDPYTIDGVLIYAQRGHGRRANLYTDYTFAVWDGDALVPFAKAYSGLTDKEIQAVDTWVKRHTIDKFGPVRSVTASLVFELAFEGISASPRHKSGIALRFPRILRWRKDKTAQEANTKADLLALLKESNNNR